MDFSQARTLHLIALAYSGDEFLFEKAKGIHRNLAEFCLHEWQTTAIDVRAPEEGDQAGIVRAWYHWKENETKRRVGYLIWVSDSQTCLPLPALLTLLLDA